MSDLIDKEVLYNRFADLEAVALEQVKKYVPHENLTEWRIWSSILAERTAYKHDVFDAPVVDAEPVIRCKDCKYAYMTYDGECKYCDVWEAEGEMYLDGDFYCAFGKRKEDEIND